MYRVDHTPLRYRIHQKIRDKIIYKVWKSGTILSEGELAKSFNTSRTPVREAIRQLETEGLIRVIPKKGILIPEIEDKEIEDISELLEIIHCRAVEKAVEKVSPKDIERLEKIIAEADNYIGKKTKINKVIALGIQFSELILKCSGNKRFLEIDKQIRGHMIRFTSELCDDEDRSKIGWNTRKEIVAALKKKDKRLAGLKMRKHYQKGKKFLLEISNSGSKRSAKKRGRSK